MQKSPITAALVALVIASAAAAFPPSEDLHAKANALLVQAQKVAVFDPNSSGAPFHESVSFLFSGLIQGDQNGTFVRDWVSKKQWRWKWEVPGYQEISVRNGEQVGERETAEFESVRIQQLRCALPPFNVILSENDLVKKIELEKVNGLEAQCIKFEAVRGRDRWSREVCVNASNSTVLRWADERREIEWTDYTPFRETFYPRHLAVKEHGNKIIQADIEFQDAPQLSEKAFEVPSDMRVRKACQHFTQPIVTKQENPVYPRRIGVRTVKAEVVVEVRVGVEGRVEAAQVTETGGSDLDRAALDAVKKWESSLRSATVIQYRIKSRSTSILGKIGRPDSSTTRLGARLQHKFPQVSRPKSSVLVKEHHRRFRFIDRPVGVAASFHEHR